MTTSSGSAASLSSASAVAGVALKCFTCSNPMIAPAAAADVVCPGQRKVSLKERGGKGGGRETEGKSKYFFFLVQEDFFHPPLLEIYFLIILRLQINLKMVPMSKMLHASDLSGETVSEEFLFFNSAFPRIFHKMNSSHFRKKNWRV